MACAGSSLPSRRRSLVAGDVADDLLPRDVGLVAGLALVRLARRRSVRVGIRVEEVGIRDRSAAVSRLRGRATLVVRAEGRLEEDESLPAAERVVKAERVADVPEEQRPVVAHALR